MAAGSLVAFLNLIIILQDWDFPDFSEDAAIKIVATDLSAFRLDCCSTWCRQCPRLSSYLVFYMSSKWFNYFGILVSGAFDWAYW